MATMNARAWRSWASKTLAPRLERPPHWAPREWGATNQALAATPSDWLAQGIAHSRASAGHSFQAFAWVMPLYIPFPHTNLSWSKMLASSSRRSWAFTSPASETRESIAEDLAQAFNVDGRPYLERVGRLEGFLEVATAHQELVLGDTGVFWHAEEVAYTALLIGADEKVERQLVRQSIPQPDDGEWVTASRERCAHVLQLLLEDPHRARAQLAGWAEETAAALQLTWVDPDDS